MIERNRDDGITLTTLGFGEGNYNEALMESIADLGNGNYAYIDSAMEARKVLDEEMSSTLFTIASDVKVQVEFNPAYVSQYRLIGYENRILAEEDFANDAVDAGEIGASHQVTAFYEIVPAGADGWLPERRYEGNRPAGAPETAMDADSAEMAFVQLRYKLPGADDSILIQHPVATITMDGAGAPAGDFAFGAAVAAFGQSLRGDDLLRGFSRDDIVALAGPQDGYWREEFLQLVRLSDSRVASLQ
jgi:Ca-activated chloride channel family protein